MRTHDFFVLARHSASCKAALVKPKTEELLYLLLWSCDMLARPTFRNLTDSFEAWAYRNGFHRALTDLERRELMESRTGDAKGGGTRMSERVLLLSETGRVHALGGRDPEVRWNRAWDGRWHLVLFDLPNTEGAKRNRLRNYLRSQGFGWLQNSVWIAPHPLIEDKSRLAGTKADVESILFLEARPSAGERDDEIVAGAWDFKEINRLYKKHLTVLEARPTAPLRDAIAATRFRTWAAEEREAWLEAVTADPLLPARLLPVGYLGRKAWETRVKTMRQCGKQISDFRF